MKKILLHSCCAPCSCAIIDELINNSNIKFDVYFYNPNIYPLQEYNIRKEELIKYCNKFNIKIIEKEDKHYSQMWEECIKGLEKEPEVGKRCEKCIYHRLKQTAIYAYTNDYDAFTTSLSSSRMKSFEMIQKIGKEIEKEMGIEFIDENWKKGGRQEKANEISKKENFYRQNYCGCRVSKKLKRES